VQALAPAHIHLEALRELPAAGELGAGLEAAGLRVLVDDRPDLSAGVRFTDAELLGMPYVVVVGRRFGEGYVELRERASGTRTEVPVAELIGHLADVYCSEAAGKSAETST
jgi:prolyl-tRNA synthetase